MPIELANHGILFLLGILRGKASVVVFVDVVVAVGGDVFGCLDLGLFVGGGIVGSGCVD
jgi:hypothetical protein